MRKTALFVAAVYCAAALAFPAHADEEGKKSKTKSKAKSVVAEKVPAVPMTPADASSQADTRSVSTAVISDSKAMSPRKARSLVEQLVKSAENTVATVLKTKDKVPAVPMTPADTGSPAETGNVSTAVISDSNAMSRREAPSVIEQLLKSAHGVYNTGISVFSESIPAQTGRGASRRSRTEVVKVEAGRDTTVPMTPAEARTAIAQVLPKVIVRTFPPVYFGVAMVREIRINRSTLIFELYSREYWTDVGRSDSYSFYFSDVALPDTPAFVPGRGWFITLKHEKSKDGLSLAWEKREDALKIYDAIIVLNSHALKSETDFHEKAKAWRAMAAKPPLPEEARRHKVVAENAFQEKDFGNAIEEYEAALEIAPLWPEGNFNVAFLCGELKNYAGAVYFMRRYLELMPDAADAQAARDNMYIWEAKLAKERGR